MDFKLDLISVASAAAVGAISYLFPYVHAFENLFIREVLKLSFQTPKTSTFKELNNKPLVLIKDAGRDEESEKRIVSEIMKNPNVAISGVHLDICQILKGLWSSKESFFYTSMDTVVISKMGVEVLILKYENAGYDRSIFVDITAYRQHYLYWHSLLTVLGAGMGLFLSGNGELRSLAMSIFKKKD